MKSFNAELPKTTYKFVDDLAGFLEPAKANQISDH